MLLYFLDQNAYPPEPAGMWLAGGRRADIIVRTEDPIDHLAVTVTSPVRTVVTLSMGQGTVVAPVMPPKTTVVNVPARGVRGLNSYAYLFSANSSEGFVPHLQDPRSTDGRNLGALLQFAAVGAPAAAR